MNARHAIYCKLELIEWKVFLDAEGVYLHGQRNMHSVVQGSESGFNCGR